MDLTVGNRGGAAGWQFDLPADFDEVGAIKPRISVANSEDVADFVKRDADKVSLGGVGFSLVKNSRHGRSRQISGCRRKWSRPKVHNWSRAYPKRQFAPDRALG